jgi:hypothetical protein
LGDYSAVLETKILWGSLLGKFTNFSLSNEYQAIMVEGKDSGRQLDIRLDFRRSNVVIGNMKGLVMPRRRPVASAALVTGIAMVFSLSVFCPAPSWTAQSWTTRSFLLAICAFHYLGLGINACPRHLRQTDARYQDVIANQVRPEALTGLLHSDKGIYGARSSSKS